MRLDEGRVIERIHQLHQELERRPTKWDNSQLYRKTRKFFGTWNNAMEKAGYKVKRNQFPDIPDKLTPELSYFLGILVTDGNMYANTKRGYYSIQLFNSYEDETEMLLQLIQFLFSYKSFVRKRKLGFNKRISNEIHINSKKLIYQLKEKFNIPTGAKSKTLRLPKIMFNTTKENMYNFIRGVIDGDGTISKYKIIRIASGSPKFLEDMKHLLKILDIETKDIRYERTAYVLPFRVKSTLELSKQMYSNTKFYYPRKRAKFEKQ